MLSRFKADVILLCRHLKAISKAHSSRHLRGGGILLNFVKTMLRLAAQHAELSVVADQYGCPTSARSLAALLWQLAQGYATQGHLAWGLYHFSNGPACTWHHFAEHILSQALTHGLLNKKPVIRAITTEQYPTAAPRPVWSVLSNQKIENLLQIQPVQWQDQLSELLAHPIDSL